MLRCVQDARRVGRHLICSPRRLQQLVLRQQWRAAHSYLCRFLPPPVGTERLSVEAHVLHRFLGVHTVLASIVAGVKEDPAYSQYLSHDRTVSYGAVRIRSIILSILCARQQVRYIQTEIYPVELNPTCAASSCFLCICFALLVSCAASNQIIVVSISKHTHGCEYVMQDFD